MIPRSLKKLTLFSLMFVFVFSVFYFPASITSSTTYAQQDRPDFFQLGEVLNGTRDPADLGGNNSAVTGTAGPRDFIPQGVSTITGRPVGLGQKDTGFTGSQVQRNDEGSGWSKFWSKFSPLSWAMKILAMIIGALAWVVQLAVTQFLTIAGFFFDTTVKYSLEEFGKLVGDDGAGAAIKEVWTIFRDLANIGFVFILLYIAINLILRTQTSAAKEMLGRVIIGALLINFSFFFSLLVINTSNQMAAELHKSIEKIVGEEGIAGFVVKGAKYDETRDLIDRQYGTGKQAKETSQDESQGKGVLDSGYEWAIGTIFTLILSLVLVIVLIIAGGMLIARVIILIFLIITSPIGFVGQILPQTQKMSSEWWQGLFGQAFFFPVFLLFLLIAFKLIESGLLVVESSATGNAGTEAGKATFQKLAASAVTYFLVIGFFVAALGSAKKLSSMGSSMVASASGKITASIGKGAFGAAGFAGRNTIGRGADLARKSNAVQKIADRTGALGTLGLKGLDGVAGSSFDVRGSRTFSGVASATGFGKDLGATKNKDGIKGQDKTVGKFYQGAADLYNHDEDEFKAKQGEVSAAEKDYAKVAKQHAATGVNAPLPAAVVQSHEKRIADAKKARDTSTSKVRYAKRLQNRAKKKAPALIGKWINASEAKKKAGNDTMKELIKGKDDNADIKKALAEIKKQTKGD